VDEEGRGEGEELHVIGEYVVVVVDDFRTLDLRLVGNLGPVFVAEYFLVEM
jgi:hypothetical protein